MKQCPKCSRTYANDKQKFCTKDGTALVDAADASDDQSETVRIDSAQLDEEITKVISQPLPQMSGRVFDPYKTNVATPEPAEPTPPPAATTPPPVAATPPPAATTPPPAATTPPPPPAIASSTPQVSASVPAQPTASVPQPTAPSAPKKRSKLPLILGILVVLLFLGAGGLTAGYFFGLKPWLEKRRVTVLPPRRPQPTPVVVDTPDVGSTKPETPQAEVPPYSPPADAVQFVNSSAKLDGKLAEHYVDFSFYYPKTWEKDPKAGVAGASNFARVERSLPPDFTQENFAVGWYSSSGSKEGDSSVFPTLAQNLNSQYARNPDFLDYRKTSEGPTTVGPYYGYEFRFETASRNRKDIKIWGRVIFVPPVDGSKNGLTLLMFATSLAPEIHSVDDVGVKGDLPMMLESFRFGK